MWVGKKYKSVVIATIGFVLLAQCLGFSHSALSAIYSELGNTTFVRQTGKPFVETVTFPSNRPGSTFKLNVYNGGLEDYDITGELVSSSMIKLNSVQIFGPSDFNQQVTFVSADVVLQANNILEVELRGKPDGVILINVEGDDNDLPTITSTVTPPANNNDWHSSSASVSFDCQDGTSGIEFCTSPVLVDLDGANQIVNGQAIDRAGNTALTSVTINLDSVDPTVNLVPNRAEDNPNWYKAELQLSLDCQDALSGIDTCSGDLLLNQEGLNQVLNASATDLAGNTNTDSLTLSLDLTPPTIFSSIIPQANQNNWHKVPVQVIYTCTDNLSGIAQCPQAQIIDTENAQHTVLGSASDVAGHSKQATDIVKLDLTAPNISTSIDVTPDGDGIYHDPVTVAFTCNDVLSGISVCPDPIILNEEGLGQLVEGTAIDLADNSVYTSLTIDIILNLPPSITSSPNIAVDENQLYSYSVKATDPDAGDVLSFALIQSPAGMSIDAQTGVINWQTGYDSAGIYPIVISVVDQKGEQASQSYSLTVNETNREPIITTTSLPSVEEGQVYNYGIEATDPDADSVSFSLLLSPTGMQIDPTSGTLNWFAPTGSAGDTSVIVVATDQQGATTQKVFNLSVTQTNRAPYFYSVPIITAVEFRTYLSMALAIDLDGDQLTYEVIEGPIGLTINSSFGLLIWTPSDSDAGVHHVVLQVSDVEGEFDQQIFDITVGNYNLPPTIQSTAIPNAIEGQNYQYPITAIDPDGDGLIFSLTSGPADMLIDANSGLITWLPPFNSLSQYSVGVLVTDSNGQSVSRDFLIDIQNVNQNPIILSSPEVIAIKDQEYHYDLEISDLDSMNDDLLIVQLLQGPTEMYLDTDSQSVVWTHPTYGSHNVQVQVQDVDGGLAEQSYELQVISNQVTSNSGREFVFSFQPNQTNQNAHELSIVIIAEQDARGVVNIPGINFVRDFVLPANQAIKIELPLSVDDLALNAVSRLGIQVTTDNNVTVYGVNHVAASTDAFLVLPRSSLGSEYRVLTYNGSYGPSQFNIVAVEDGTQISIQKTDGSAPIEFTLDKYDAYLRREIATLDTTGTLITASAPVAVLAGVQCATVPLSSVACDHVVEMLPPVSTWGQEFFTYPLATRLNGDIFRLLANEDNTEIRIDGALIQTINAGEYYETVLTDASHIITSKPSLVAQFATGSSFDGLRKADPFMMFLAPIEQWVNRFSFAVLDNDLGFYDYANIGAESFINVIASDTDIASIQLNNQNLDLSLFTAIDSSGYSGAQIPMSGGAHMLTSSIPISVSSYGFGNFDSYGFPTGMNFSHINPGPSEAADLLISSVTTDKSNCPETLTLTARIENQGNSEVSKGTNVSFYQGDPALGGTLIGSTQTQYRLQANQFEDIDFAWVNPNSGRYEIVVVVDDDGNGVGLVIEADESNNRYSITDNYCTAACINNFSVSSDSTVNLLSWIAEANTDYSVFRSENLTGPYSTIATSLRSTGSYIDSQISVDQTYYYHIRRTPGDANELFCDSDIIAARIDSGSAIFNVVPNIVGLIETNGQTALTNANLLVGSVSSVASDDIPIGEIIQQDPPANSYVSSGVAVNYVVSTGNTTAPFIEPGPQNVINEGSNYLSQGGIIDDDSNSWTLIVNYGDGSGNENVFVATDRSFQLNHQYINDGVYTINLQASDGNSTGYSTTKVVVNNVLPQVDAGNDRTLTIGARLIVGPMEFTDVGVADTHTATVDWGDGSQDQLILAEYEGRGTLWGVHDYIVEGNYTATITVLDESGFGSADTLQINVLAIGPPQITSFPVITAIEKVPYQYQVEAFDPDGDALDYSLLTAPSNMQINSTTGSITWTAFYYNIGANPVTVQVSDGVGGSTTQSFDITAVAGEGLHFSRYPESPSIVSDELYQYDVDAIHSAGLPITYSLDQAPAGMAIESTTGFLAWSPSDAQVGTHNFTIVGADNQASVNTVDVVIEVTQNTNQAPIISSSPELMANLNLTYQYQLIANDPEGHGITFTLPTAPAGMAIDGSSGLIQWFPNSIAAGDYAVTVRATDERGRFSEQPYNLILVDNLPPQLSGTVPSRATTEFDYGFVMPVIDPENDTLTFSVRSGPTGFNVSPQDGLIQWSPTIEQAGDHEVSVFVYDGTNTVWFTWPISVNAELQPINVSASLEPQFVNQNETTTLSVFVNGGASQLQTQVRVDGQLIILDNNSQAVLSSSVVGRHDILIEATDGNQIATFNGFYAVADPNDMSAPVVDIISPENTADITAPTPILGTVQDDSLIDVLLAYRRADQDDFIELYRGNDQFLAEAIAQFDPTMLVNGTYQLLLQATDSSGNTQSDAVALTVDGDLKVGNFSFTVEDLNIPLAGIPIQVTRTYDSRRRNESLGAGYGWNVDYQGMRIEESDEPSKGWYFFYSPREIFLTPFGAAIGARAICPSPTFEKTVSVTLPNGDVEKFQVRAEPVSLSLRAFSNPNCYLSSDRFLYLRFDPVGNTQSTLTARVNELYLSDIYNGDLTFLGEVGPADISKYTLTTRGGYRYDLDENFGIEQITDPNGNSLTYNTDGIVHSSGVAIDIERDSEGRITVVRDPLGNEVNYLYNSSGDLINVFDRDGALHSYGYDNDHRLIDMLDPLDRRLVKNIYGDTGRLIAQEDQDGNRTDFNHDLPGRQSIVTDRNGNATVFFYNDRGDVGSQIDALGNVTQYTHDSEGNQLSETNALGFTSSATFNANDDQLSQTDALGNSTVFEYNQRGQETTITDAKGNDFNNSYDGVGNLLSITDPQGNSASNVINARGLVLNTTDILGNITSFTYDSQGNKLTETDAEGGLTTYTYNANNDVLTDVRRRTLSDGSVVNETTSFEYDELNRVTAIVDHLGNRSETEYDLAGQVTAEIDPLGRRTEMDYDAYGRLIETRYANGNTETKTYDSEGNLLTDTNRSGNTTTFEYDALNRQTAVVTANGARSQTEYDVIGRVIVEIDSRGNRTEHEYDPAGRRTLTRDALSNEHNFEYDENGNLTAEIDAIGRRTEYLYNTLDQRVQTTYADGTTMAETLDALGRRTAQTDQAGVATQYLYDSLGRLTTVTDVQGNTTTYSYDEVGNKLTQTDAEGRNTRWEYDSLGRVISRTLPLGQVETMAYDANSNMDVHVDFNGDITSYTYDTLNRLTESLFADGSIERFTYDNVGNRTQAVQIDIDGFTRTTTFTYDALNRLASETKVDGTVLSYSYDLAGNKTQLTVTLPDTTREITSYTYDVLNRLQTVTDSNGTTSYGYDSVGNRASVSHANGSSQVYIYDSLNRLTRLETYNGAGTLVQAFDYTLHATGRRESIDELGGRSTVYGYDNLYRLTSETVTDPVNGNYTANYQYDSVGNRTYETVDGVQTAYTYDLNDRLLQTGGTTFTYDSQGNTLTETLDGVTTIYNYNSQQELVSQSQAGVVTDFAYNADGIRNAKGDISATTNFLIDHNLDYAQVIREDDGTTVVAYTYGDDLVSQSRDGVVSYYLYDGLGSTRALSDSSGNITDEYNYEAFGELLNQIGSTENSYLFTGEQFDSTLDQYYLRARYYNQGIGRFTQQDTYQGNNYDPVSLHKYLYGPSDPVNFLDPSGNSFFSLTGGGSILSTLSTLATANIGRAALKKVAVGLIGAGIGVGVGNSLYHYFSSKVIGKDLDQIRAKTEARVTSRAKGRRLLFHYTTRGGALAISACQCIFPTVYKGPTADGFTRPTGAYATTLLPWSKTGTQSAISRRFFGGTDARVGKLGWFVAIDGSDFFPYGQPGEYVKPVKHPLQPLVHVRVITIGPNPMPLTE